MNSGIPKPGLLVGILCSVIILTLSAQANATETTLFYEDFEGYSYFPDEYPAFDPINKGIPKISEGANEIWYGGRFEEYDDGTIDQDLAVQKFGGSPNNTHTGRFEDEAGLLFNINTLNYTDVKLSFDYRTFHTDRQDKVVAGYLIGDLNFGSCLGNGEPGCFRDFFTEDLGGSQSAAESWWNTDWTEIVRDRGEWKSIEDYALPSGEENVWIAFWLDNGEKDFGKIDNIQVHATLVPEPISSALFLLGGSAFGVRRFFA
ncbi:MAG: PEP-CTERM sorting domain-containing protein [Candidatus Omnitrophica bacterium]|nr:PEP-CTERM sorting domain-containing protein [Candidatus Omnitrophota bacterium]